MCSSDLIQQVLDPTLLLDATAWNPLIGKCPENRPYVVLYQVRENPAVRMKAFEIAQSIGGIVVELTARIDCHYSTKYQTASPADFVTYIRYATYVVTIRTSLTCFIQPNIVGIIKIKSIASLQLISQIGRAHV